MSTRHTTVTTSYGELTLVATGAAITGVYFPHHWYAPDPAGFGARVDAAADALLARAGAELTEYLAGERRHFDVPFAPAGDDFQRRVWTVVSAIAYGAVRTYGDIAAELGDPGTGDEPPAKRVGQAVGRNPVSILIPCHRVVGAGGKITGYAGGPDRKRRLLELEARAAAPADGRLF